jgi:hypothetical protein
VHLVLLAQCMLTDKHVLCKGKNYSNYAENITYQCTKFSFTGKQGLMICAPLFYKTFIFRKSACKVGGELHTHTHTHTECTSWQSDNSQETCAECHSPTFRSHSQQVLRNCIFFHSYNLLNVFWKSACKTKDTHNCQVKK